MPLTASAADITYQANAGLACSTSGSNFNCATASNEAAFLTPGALTCGAGTSGAMKVHTTPLQYCDDAATPTLKYAAYGSSTGVASSATTAATLTTPRTIGGTSFDGSANIAIGALTSTNVGATTSAQFLDVISDETGTGAVTFATSPTFTTSIIIPNGASPTVDAAGKLAVDTTDDQLVFYGGAKRVLTYERECGIALESLVSTDDNYAFCMIDEAITVTGVACNCRGTCSTLATFTLEDRGGNAMTITGTNPTCATTGAATYAAVTAANQLTAGEMAAFDVTNTPTTGDTYVLKIKYTTDAQ